MKKTFLVILTVLVFAAGMAYGSYNRLISMEEEVTNKQAYLETQLQKRNDLIPNLASTVQGFAAHEDDVFDAVVVARAKLATAKTVADLNAADNEVHHALAHLLTVAENYPELKSSSNFSQLQDDLAKLENNITLARMDYNASVQRLNERIKTLPDSLFAGPLGFHVHDYYKNADISQQIPEIQ